MRFGVSYLPDAAPGTMDPVAYYRAALELAELADQAGFSSVKMTEHYLHPYGGYCPSPLSFFSAVAARTRRLRMITGCILPSFHHPVQIAAEAAMVDALSAGRLEVGFARAYMPYEFETFGVDLDDSRARYEATIEAVLRLWTATRVSMDTPFFRFRDATSLPPVTQRPHPPVWAAAVRARQSFAWIGERGFGLLATFLLTDLQPLKERIAVYRESFAAAHGDGVRPRVAVSQPLYVAPTDAAAVQEGDAYLARYFDVWADGADAWSRVQSRDYPGYSAMPHAIRAATPDVLRRTGAAAFGDPDRVLDHVRWLREELNPDEILWQLDFGAMPLEASRRTLTLFADKVMGRL
jgi:alkanesulfonate monooxygenase SsuD/methylene tetrahydromethanopterin reductase-like flavin-dependent oxidoreductase (luciferase family)